VEGEGVEKFHHLVRVGLRVEGLGFKGEGLGFRV
jgi:hypothetical protein